MGISDWALNTMDNENEEPVNSQFTSACCNQSSQVSKE